MNGKARQFLRIMGIAAIYYIAGRVGMAFSFAESGASPMWPASGVALASLLIFGYWVWPGVLVGAFASNYHSCPSALIAFFMALGSTLAALCSLFTLKRILGFENSIGRVRDALALIFVGTPLYAGIAATVAVTSLGLDGAINSGNSWNAWITFFAGDAVGILIVTPFLLSMLLPFTLGARQMAEGIALLAASGVLAWVVFHNNISQSDSTISFPYILFPLTLWLSLRFGMLGASASALVISCIAVWASVLGQGPFARDSELQGLVLLDSYIAILSISALMVVAIVNERKRSEEERDRFFSLSLDMLCIIDSSGYFRRLSPAFEDTLGWSMEEMKSRPFITFVHPDDIEATLAEVDKQTLRGENVLQFENRYRHIDGSWRVLSWKSVPQPGGYLYATARDVTNNWKMQAALRESEERFRTMADSIPQLAWMAHPDGDIFWYNERWYEYTGSTLEEMRGWGWQSVHDPKELPRVLKTIKESFASGEPWEEVFPLRRHDGEFRWYLTRMRAIKDAEGKVLQWFGTNTDISEAKDAEELIKREAKRLSVILNSIGEAIITTDAEGGVMIMNPVAEHMTGVKLESAKGLPIGEIIKLKDENTREEFPLDIRGILSSENQNRITLSKLLIGKNGKEHNIALSASPVRVSEADFFGAVIVFRDITEERAIASARKEIERQRAESDRMAREAAESANKAKSAFVASMSHEIRTPMNAILGFAQILQRDATLSPQQAANVSTINRAGLHLLSLIDDILEISKIEAGRLVLAPAVFSLHELLGDLEMMFRSRCEAKGLRLLVELEENVPKYVEADESKLRQVFINLLGNAVKFTDSGGVAMRVRAVPVSNANASDVGSSEKLPIRLEVEIEDTGMGIGQEEMDGLFQNFAQTSAGAKVGGTGLGLSICKNLIEMMGGDISVRSELGKGSCFKFNVIIKTAEKSVVTSEPYKRKVIGVKPVETPIRALIVDDNSDNRALLRSLLHPLGISTREALTGREALSVFERFSPSVVLMDMRMPDMDGYEATRLLRSTLAGSNIPIIAVTASAFDDAESQVMRAGVDAYIRKPFRNELFFETLGRLLGLEYEYEEDPAEPKAPKLNIAHLSVLPEALLQSLRLALESGEMEKVHVEIDEVEKIDLSIARQLRRLAENYDYERLGGLLG